MVDMNVVMLEGIGFYMALAIFLFLVVAALVLAWSGIKQDEKIEELQEENKQLEISNTILNRENYRYKLKYGELDPGKEVDSDVGNKM